MVGETLPATDRTMEFQHLIAWNYRTQEMTSMLALLAKLRRLIGTTHARRNGHALTRRLEGVKGIDPPFVPAECEAIYHKYRIRLNPEALDVPLRGTAFREVVRSALLAEGVDAVTWLEAPLPAHPIFQVRNGFGGGYPWTVAHADYRYRVEDYPQTQQLVDNS